MIVKVNMTVVATTGLTVKGSRVVVEVIDINILNEVGFSFLSYA